MPVKSLDKINDKIPLHKRLVKVQLREDKNKFKLKFIPDSVSLNQEDAIPRDEEIEALGKTRDGPEPQEETTSSIQVGTTYTNK